MNEIVTIQNREAVTTSLKVAFIFGKRHDNVVTSIRKLINEISDRGLLKFKDTSYLDEQGKPQPLFEMGRDGFSLLAMGFTGKKALKFKLNYIDAFNKMEAAVLQRNNLAWQEDRKISRIGRRTETDTISRFVKFATEQGSQNAKIYFMQITKMTNKVLGLLGQAGPQPFRDLLDSTQLSALTVAEVIVCEVLGNGMRAGLHYKYIYQLAREKVERYADTLPTSCKHRQLAD